MTTKKQANVSISNASLRTHIVKHNEELGAVLNSVNMIDRHVRAFDRRNSESHKIIHKKIDKLENICVQNKCDICWLKKISIKKYGVLYAVGTVIFIVLIGAAKYVFHLL